MASNPITAGKPKKAEKTPTDPQECCDFLNARLDTDEREWVVTGNKDRPIALFRKIWPKRF